MAEKKNNGGCVLIILGPALVCLSVVALWKNETRFDFHRAAQKTSPIVNQKSVNEGQQFSFTGSMDQSLKLPGKYAESFQGYLSVIRSAEIYCWDKSEDDDGDVTWSRRWMSSVESNSRNTGITQQLDSGEIQPNLYEIDALEIKSDQIEFVDSYASIDTSMLAIGDQGQALSLIKTDGYFYLHKNQSQELGDERLSFRGLPVPETATYFGKFSNGIAVADDSHKRDGMINQLIQDTGILHHLVAGDRETALATMKAYISRLKWIVRGVGTFCIVFGFFLAFASVFQFLYRIPVIGPIAEYGSWLFAMILGIPVAVITIVLAYTFSHPVLVFGVLAAIFGFVYWLGSRRRKTQLAIKSSLDQEHGHELDANELKELEFLELASLAVSDSDFGQNERDFLIEWGKQHDWDKSRCDVMIEKAKTQAGSGVGVVPTDQHLHNLIKIAMADGTLSPFEIKTIRTAAKNAGYDHQTVNELMGTIEQSAAG